MADYEVGYGKPPRDKQFGQPDGPATGKTSAQRKQEIANAEIATKIRGKMLKAALSKMVTEDDAMAMVEAAMLKLLVDSENRGLGAPKQTVEATVGSAPKGLDTFYGETKEGE